MSASIPFSSETFRPICPLNNDKAEQPVEFGICAVGGPSRARLKSILLATSGLSAQGGWSPEVQEATIKAFETGAPLFAEGVTWVKGVTAPAALLKRVGLLPELPKGTTPESQIPITTGYEFSQVCGYWTVLSFEVAMAIAKISGEADVDPRFFGWLSTSLRTQMIGLGAVGSARTRSNVPGTAAKGRTVRRRRSTSPPSQSE